MMAPWLFHCAANCNGRLISSFVASQPSRLEPKGLAETPELYGASQPARILSPSPVDTSCILRELGMGMGSGIRRFCFLFFHSCISYAVRLTPISRFSSPLHPHRWTYHEGRKLHGADTLLSTPEETDNVSLTAESAHSVALAWYRATGNVSNIFSLISLFLPYQKCIDNAGWSSSGLGCRSWANEY